MVRQHLRLRIPRTFHRIWLGGGMPQQYELYGESWLHWHPQWRMITWTENNLPPLQNQRQFDDAGIWAQKADIARYEILYRYGGVYIDTDFECLQNIEDLLEGI